MALASAAIVFHFGAVLVPILDTPSGPWATPAGRSMEDPPAFAHALRNLADWHGQYLRLANNDHFVFNRPASTPAVEMEVRLKDDAGKVTRTLRFPDPQANPWVRQRQELLARRWRRTSRRSRRARKSSRRPARRRRPPTFG